MDIFWNILCPSCNIITLQTILADSLLTVTGTNIRNGIFSVKGHSWSRLLFYDSWCSGFTSVLWENNLATKNSGEWGFTISNCSRCPMGSQDRHLRQVITKVERRKCRRPCLIICLLSSSFLPSYRPLS